MSTPRPPKPSISVVAPCYNEMENAVALTRRLQNVFRKRGLEGEVVLVNDASQDRTGEIIDQLAQQYPNVKAVHHEKNRGIARAWQSGIDASRGAYVCLIDADLQYLPEEVWRLYKEITTSRVDMVQGFRSSIERLRDSRYLFSVTLNTILNLTFGMSLQDNKSGFVIARRETLAHILEHQYDYHYFNTYIAVSAHSKGYSIKEVETLFRNRDLGESYIQGFPLRLITRVLIDTVKAFFEFRVFRRSIPDLYLTFVRTHPVDGKKMHRYTGWRKTMLDLFFLTMPLHKWMITRNAKRYYEALKTSEWYDSDTIRELQQRRLRQLVRHVYLHVPYWNAAMDERGLTPEDIQTPEDLSKLPLLSKQTVREDLYFDLFADNHQKSEMLKISTSGSTGEPMVLYGDRRQLEMRWATTLRATEWTGWRFGDRQARLWHQTLGMSKTQVFRERLDALFMRRLFIPAFELTEEKINELVHRLRKFQPVLIDGYAESFNFLAHYASKNDVEDLSPKAIMTSAQIMPQQVRELIETEFNTKVFDKYGSREFSGIAYECDQHDGHHIMSESYIVEILKDNRPAKPGELGEVVITDLNNYAVPLIRYRLGDLAIAMDPNEICACGRSLPRIGRIEGRAQAIVFAANGRWLPGTFFAHFFKDYDHAILQYQVVQDRRAEITLRVVPNFGYSPVIMESILEKLRGYMGRDMKIDVELMNEIPLLATGKRTGVISNLDYDFQRVSSEDPSSD